MILNASFLLPIIAGLYTAFVQRQIHSKLIKRTPKLIVELICLHGLAYFSTCELSGWCGFSLLFGFIWYLQCNLPPVYLPGLNKAVLITGCDSGFGHVLARRLNAIGIKVFAGCLDADGEGARSLKELGAGDINVVQLDVTNLEDVSRAVKFVKTKLGTDSLWALVNNAGILYAGNTELMSEADMRKLMDVNFWGPVRVTRAFLPMLRRSQGRLVNVLSNAGLVPVPLIGAYCASKAALTSLTEVWRSETRDWGVKVSIVIPSGFKTGIMNYNREDAAERWWQAASDDVRKDFGKETFLVTPKSEGIEDKVLNGDLRSIVDAMVDGILSTSPKIYYYKGLLARSMPFIYSHFPTRIADVLLSMLADWFQCAKPAGLLMTNRESILDCHPLIEKNNNKYESDICTTR